MRRISVVGVPGSGKTTVGRMLADQLGLTFIELDSIFHQSGWQPLPQPEFRAAVAERMACDGWVIDGNYAATQDLVWAAADTVVWFDLPRGLIMRRVTARTLRRTFTRTTLWNGNREPWSNLYRLDPERNIVRWAWIKYPEYQVRYAEATADPANAHLRVIRLRSPQEVDQFLAAPC